MPKIDWKTFKKSFPFICDRIRCKAGHWEKRDICEECGEKGTIRETTKKDYKIYLRDK